MGSALWTAALEYGTLQTWTGGSRFAASIRLCRVFAVRLITMAENIRLSIDCVSECVCVCVCVCVVCVLCVCVHVCVCVCVMWCACDVVCVCVHACGECVCMCVCVCV